MLLYSCNLKTDSQKKELVEYPTSLFPIASYYDDLMEQDVPWHWHEDLEALIVVDGCALVSAGTTEYVVNTNEAVFINGNILHAARIHSCNNCHFHSIVFHPSLVGGSLDSIFWQKYLNPLVTNPLLKSIHLNREESWHTGAIQNIEAAWQSCANEPAGYEFEVRSLLSQLIFQLSCYHPSHLKQPSQKEIRSQERVKAMLQYIQIHYQEPVTVSMLANAAMISESECLRCFRQTIHVTPIQYLKQFRVQKAAELLLSSSHKIADIGNECGFPDTSYFIKSFRELKNCTPSSYRSSYPSYRY